MRDIYFERERCTLKFFLVIISLIAALAASAWAQSAPATGTLRGTVLDPSGAVVANAKVAAAQSGGPARSATTNPNGAYEIENLPPGKYTVTANAKGFSAYAKTDVSLEAGQVSLFNISLEINVEKEKVNVEEETLRSTSIRQATLAPSCSPARILTLCPTIPTNCSPILRLWPAPPPAPTAASSTSMGSPAASFRPSHRSAKFASTRIRFQPSTTSWVTAASRFSPSPAPTSFTDSFRSRATARP